MHSFIHAWKTPELNTKFYFKTVSVSEVQM